MTTQLRRTRKWTFVAQEAQRLASIGLSSKDIATRLGLNRSTVTRWVKAGKLTRGEGVAGPPVTARAPLTPAEWSAQVRETYDLDATDEQLVTVAESALALSLDDRVKPQIRMTAAGRYASIVNQLKLPARLAAAQASAPVVPELDKRPVRPAVQRRRGVDPRNVLTAVK